VFALLIVLFLYTANDNEDPYPSLSDYHDYEPNLEFDDTELQASAVESGKVIVLCACGFLVSLR
jgi:hypothetical protein